jgi:hypothetical protein
MGCEFVSWGVCELGSLGNNGNGRPLYLYRLCERLKGVKQSLLFEVEGGEVNKLIGEKNGCLR